MRIVTLLLLLSISFLACQEEQAPISQSKMANVLTDLHIAETYAQLSPISRDGISVKNTDTMLMLYATVLKKHNLDSASFYNAMEWYKARPEVFDLVYEEVLNKLSLLKEKTPDSAKISSLDSNIEANIQVGRFKDTL